MGIDGWTWRVVIMVMAMAVMEFGVGVSAQGSWKVLVKNAGISSMHTAITHYNTALLLDRTNIGASEIKLANGDCRINENDRRLNPDCTAHSVMLDPVGNSVRALKIQTDTWCSSGQFFADGTMVQTGGDFDGLYTIRRLAPCKVTGTCDWVEDETTWLTDPRWYASNQLLPDGLRQIVVGGRNAFTYEFVPKRERNEGAFELQLLKDTNTNQGDNMYPFIHLLPNGNLYIFANRDSIVLNYNTNKVVKTFPTIPGEPRNYPSAGSSVMLPLTQADGFSFVEVLICGGSKAGAFTDKDGDTWAASRTCGRIDVTAKNPEWAMENMPMRRTMGDMVILPTGDVVIINGAEKGAQGWGKARDAVLTPVKYNTNNAKARWETLATSKIPRVYHSTANLLGDGRILVAGSNTHQFYTFTGEFPTELRVEAYSPAYGSDTLKPTNVFAPGSIRYGREFTVTFTVPKVQGTLEVNLISSPFVTHSYAMGLRVLKLKTTAPKWRDDGFYEVTVMAPPNNAVAPASYYMLFVVQDGVPATARWVQMRS